MPEIDRRSLLLGRFANKPEEERPSSSDIAMERVGECIVMIVEYCS